MHSMIVSLTYVTLALVELVGLSSSRPVEAVILAASVAFIGVPHGAFDHVVAQRLFKPMFGSLWSALFFISYLAMASCVVVGWFFWPVGTILAFFFASAWHFGIEDCESNEHGWLKHALAIASGGLVIWFPALIRRRDVIDLLALVIPDEDQRTAVVCATSTAACAVVLVPLVLLSTVKSLTDFMKRERSLASLLSSDFFRNLTLILLCATVSPLVSFTVYFCGWHSIRGLIRIAGTVEDHPLMLALKLAPLTILAIGLAVAGSSVWSSTQLLTPSLIRTVFIALSALAVPHLFLYVSDDLISRKRPANTF
jgi:Brp/Blh family beta-carotene 15,15'-monooxygenase